LDNSHVKKRDLQFKTMNLWIGKAKRFNQNLLSKVKTPSFVAFCEKMESLFHKFDISLG